MMLLKLFLRQQFGILFTAKDPRIVMIHLYQLAKKKKIPLTEVNTVTDLNCMDHHDRKKKVVTLNSWLYKPNTPRSLKFMRATQR